MAIIKRITPTEFSGQYMTELSGDFKALGSALQIHDIAQTSGFIKVPTPLHRPEFNFIVHITKGNAKQQVDSGIASIKQDEILFVRQGSITSLKEVSPDAAGKIILFEEQILNQLLSKQELIKLFSVNTVILLSEESSIWLTGLFELLRIELQGSNMDLSICCSLLQAGLQKIFNSSGIFNKGINRSTEITFNFKELVYKNHLKYKTVLFYADGLSVSENYLSRCVRDTTGVSPKEWINKISILQSQLLLQDLTKSISEIAYELGYGDPSYFGRLFKNITGVTPSEYRNRFMHDLSE